MASQDTLWGRRKREENVYRVCACVRSAGAHAELMAAVTAGPETPRQEAIDQKGQVGGIRCATMGSALGTITLRFLITH